MSERKSISIQEQVDFLDALVKRCTMRGGEIAGTTDLTLTGEDALFLKGVADRLFRMVDHEDRIRRLVLTGR